MLVFFGRNTSSMFLRLSSRCAGHLSTKKMTFLLAAPIFAPKQRGHLVNTAEVIHAFLLKSWSLGRMFPLKPLDSEELLAPLHTLAQVSFHCTSAISYEITEHPQLVSIVDVARLVVAEDILEQGQPLTHRFWID
ncbi:hypothetical protein PR048_014379 [Dryococelus australis]|uniref:Uncharacterized protein n=1 Tax=Dryococelus australis TaxID=614101 RepID=A0ABQ9HE32_9NEOP|nr:hypothetical protein PR048_014379 [Dryococelus australis]